MERLGPIWTDATDVSHSLFNKHPGSGLMIAGFGQSWWWYILNGAVIFSANVSADEWPQWRGPRRDGTWRETGVVDRFSSAELKPLWRAPIGSGYSGPTVADGRVFVTDRVIEPQQL